MNINSEVEQSNNSHGILLILGSLFFWVIMNAFAKELIIDYHAVQVLFFRNIFTLPILLSFILIIGGFNALKTHRFKDHGIRGILGVTSMVTLYFGLKDLPLSEVVALTYASPIFMTILGMFFLGEPSDKKRWLAILVGFLGVIVIVRPSGAMNMAALVVLFSVFCFAMTIIKTRQLSTTEPSTLIVFFSVLIASLFSIIFLPWVWITPINLLDWTFFFVVGMLGTLSQLMMALAVRFAPVSTLAPFEYLSLIFALGIDFFLWGITPEIRVFYGVGLIIGVGIYFIYKDTSIASKMREQTIA